MNKCSTTTKLELPQIVNYKTDLTLSNNIDNSMAFQYIQVISSQLFPNLILHQRNNIDKLSIIYKYYFTTFFQRNTLQHFLPNHKMTFTSCKDKRKKCKFYCQTIVLLRWAREAMLQRRANARYVSFTNGYAYKFTFMNFKSVINLVKLTSDCFKLLWK